MYVVWGKSLRFVPIVPLIEKKEFYGILKAYDDSSVTIESEDGTEQLFQKADIALIRLAFDF